MSNKVRFGSKVGLVAATVGSAVGLGNIWRFPAETQANGGAAFLLLYVICVFILGIPVMLAEFSLGRAGRSDSVGAFRKLSSGTKWWIAGALAITASYLILSYYMVVAGWTLEYFWQSVTGDLFRPESGSCGLSGTALYDGMFRTRMNEYIYSDWSPMIFTFAMIAINIGVLVCGVKKGIERLSNVLMPLLFILLVGFCFYTLRLPGAGEGLSFFLSADFSKITPSVMIDALGQTFFSLSLGMGILITYSSYYPKDTKLTRTSVIVSFLSLLVAILVGFIIFPAVKTFGLDQHGLEGTTLVFVTLPEVFAQLPGTQLWSIAFFLLLLVAVLTSTVSIAEVSIAFMQDHFRMSRLKACMTVMLPLFLLSALCSLSFGSLSWLTISGKTIFNFLDMLSTNIMLPVVSILVCLYVGWFGPKDLLRNELSNYGTIRSRVTTVIMIVIRYLAPLMILAIFISNLL